MKYNIPDTTGAFNSCEKFVVTLGESFDEGKESFSPVQSFIIRWPKLDGMEGIFNDILDILNAKLSSRQLPLVWAYRSARTVCDSELRGISLPGMVLVTKEVTKKKHTICVDGKLYKVDAEKLETLLKSLE